MFIFVEDPARPPPCNSLEHGLALLRYLDGYISKTEMLLPSTRFNHMFGESAFALWISG